MESKNELNETYINILKCYYFDDIMRIRDINFDNILLDQKSYKTYESISIFEISNKTFMGAKTIAY